MIRKAPFELRQCLTALALCAVLTACSDDDVVTLDTGDGAGGGAGDVDANDAIAPFAGVWDITGNWRGNPSEDARLVIRSPADGEATAVIYDLADFDNCYERGVIDGVVELSPLGDSVFLSNLPDFDEAVLELTDAANLLNLEFTDRNDIDDDGETLDRVIYRAPRDSSSMEEDLPICTF